MISIYAIRHKPTGKYLPQPVGRNRRGGSHVEPEDPDEQPPRFFTSLTTAKIVLSHWLKGKVIAERGNYYNPSDGSYDYYEDFHTTPCPDRKREDMEIVKFNLIEEVPNGNP